MGQETIHKGPLVAAAGTGINLALGVLYAWSIFKVEIKRLIESGTGPFNWELTSLNDPYALACLVFAFGMILAGRVQDKVGPRITAFVGGVLVGLGFLLISQSAQYHIWIIGFGVLVGMGLAFGYSAATPAALKWFPPHRTGRIAGIVVAGFGLAPVYIAPLGIYLLSHFGIESSMMILGLAFLLVVGTLSMFLKNPPEGYTPPGFIERRASADRSDADDERKKMFVDANESPMSIIRMPQFWLLWFLYFIGSGAGLMVIGSVAEMAKKSMGTMAFVAVALLAVGNASGRIVAGVLSDRIGRKRTLAGVFLIQAALMFGAVSIVGGGAPAFMVVLLAMMVGFNYGANLSLFPSFAKDLWGIKHFGVNYGMLFTAWGVGGFVMGRASQVMSAGSGSFSRSFILAGGMLVIGVLMAYLIDDHKERARRIYVAGLALAGGAKK